MSAESERHRANQPWPTKTLIVTSVMAFIMSASFAFFFVDDVPPSTHPEPVPQHVRPAPTTRTEPEAVATTAEVTSIHVRGTTLRVGDSADKVLNTFDPADLKGLDFTPDPTHPEELTVTRQYNVYGQSFALKMGRTHLLGPERIVRITLSSARGGIRRIVKS
jgi:hypothetical protein